MENYQIFRIVLRSLDCSPACREFSVYHLPSKVLRKKTVSLGYLGGIAATQHFEWDCRKHLKCISAFEIIKQGFNLLHFRCNECNILVWF